MQQSKGVNNKYLRLEIAFFVFYYFLFGILTDIEIQLFEPNIPAQLTGINILPHLVYGLIRVIPVWILYKFIIEKYFFKGLYLQFLLLLAVYFVALNFYNLYSNWLIAQLNFLPAYITKQAATRYQAKTWLHIGGLMYTLREYMVLAFFAYFIKSAKQDEQMNHLKQQQLNTELKYLKVQLQPHFFFNTLNNIYALTLQKSDKAAPLVAKHADMMRYILYNTASQNVGLQHEVDFLRDYVAVERMRYADDIDISFDTQGIENSVLIEPLLLLPIIENTFKHGLREEVNGGYINIIICLIKNELTVETRNSKAPIADTQPGIGLKNMRQRLRLLYPDHHQLDIIDNKDNYQLNLTLKLRTND